MTMTNKIYGEIYDCEELRNLAEEIRTSPDNIELVLNSPGGDVMVAFDICDAIQKCDHEVKATVEVMAASAAAVIALACDKVVVDKNSLMMLHHCWTMAVGNKEELEQEVNAMKAIDKVMDNIVATHCKNPEQLREAMKAGDVWLTGDEIAELFDNVELVEIDRPEGLKAAYGGLGSYVASLRKEKAEAMAKIAELTKAKEPEYTIDDELKALLEMQL